MTSANQPLEDRNSHRCTRGGCGMPLASHEDQDAHNLTHHLNDAPYQGDPFKGIPNAHDEDNQPLISESTFREMDRIQARRDRGEIE